MQSKRKQETNNRASFRTTLQREDYLNPFHRDILNSVSMKLKKTPFILKDKLREWEHNASQGKRR